MWYASLEPTEVEGVFLGEIVTEAADIGKSGSRCLHWRKRRIFVITSL